MRLVDSLRLKEILTQHKVSKVRAGYTSTNKGDKCSDCKYYLPGDCKRVDKNSSGADLGRIDPNGWCELYLAKVD